MTDKPWTREQRERLDKAVEDAVYRSSDEEFLVELETQGVDTEAVADEMRQGMLETIRKFQEQRRSQASRQPGSPGWKTRPIAELRAVLERTSRRIDRKQALTFAHRGRSGAELTDAEVLAALQALEDLGCELDFESES